MRQIEKVACGSPFLDAHAVVLVSSGAEQLDLLLLLPAVSVNLQVRVLTSTSKAVDHPHGRWPAGNLSQTSGGW
jgi:hypothetical protein